ncbi:uncharacterized protein DFL_001296 [Arthrobotrys flagrans]|uniref:Uncharacterized protein n=1 Tax=Arthrobotrys flagrans TaxID=97331 RepID=A0A437AGQ9_ARTFL|nr:hypothetical protein DFL_001296 [Arthrobotrys flagrans]
MKSSSLGLVVLWALAGGTLALNEVDLNGVGRKNLAARDTDAVPGLDLDSSSVDLDEELEDDWDENLAIRSLAPEIFEGQEAQVDVNKLSRRSPTPGLLPAISFNVHPGVTGDGPQEQRKNPAREHWEFLCNWRSPRENFNIRFIYDLLTDYLESYSNLPDWCSGPNNFCTKVWCQHSYFVEVCNYGTAPWQVLCTNVISLARDIVIAKANLDPNIWEWGFPERPRSKQQETNDRKKICINHSSVYQPEALGIAFFNTMPRFFVRLSYGYPESRVPCEHAGVQGDIRRASASQEQYMRAWYGRIQIADIDGDDKKGSGGAKPSVQGEKEDKDDKTKGRIFPPKGSVNDTDNFGLPYYKDPGGTYPDVPEVNGQANGYFGPPMTNYDPRDFIIPGLEGLTKKSKPAPPKNVNGTGKVGGGMKPSGSNELNMGDNKKGQKGGQDGGPKPIPENPILSMWHARKKPSAPPWPKGPASPTIHWTYDTTRIAHASKGLENHPTGAPAKATPSGADTPEKTDDAAAATESQTKPTAVRVTIPPKSEVKGGAPVTTSAAKPSQSGEATSAKVESTSARDEPTAAKTEPTAVKEEPASSKSGTTPPKAEPTSGKDEAKPTSTREETKPTSAKEEPKPTSSTDETKPTSAKDEAKSTAAPTPSDSMPTILLR